jgi:uncharacterized membrane protein
MKAMKVAGIVVAVILFVYAILAVGQIWGHWFDWDNFIKLTITAGIVVVAVGIIALIWRELIEEKELKRDNFID